MLTLEVTVPGPGSQPQLLQLTLLPHLQEDLLTGMVGVARPAAEAPEMPPPSALAEVIFGAVADTIFVLQQEAPDRYRFQFVNLAFEKLLGLEAKQIVGHLLEEFVPEPTLSLVRAHYRQAIQTNQRVTWIEAGEYTTGRLIGKVSVTPVYDAAHHSWRLVGAMHDLTAQKDVEEDLRVSNERFAYALKATFYALYDWDIRTGELVWGEGFEVLFGLEPGRRPPTFEEWARRVHPDDAPRVLAHLDHTTYHTQETIWQQEYRFRHLDGSWAIVFERGCLIRDEAGQPLRMIGAMQDTTERREAEEKQRQLTQELLRQNTDLQQFTYIVSHNLRAPLANARGFADLLPRLDNNSEAFAQSLRYLQTCLQQLDGVITDVNAILSIRDKAEARRPEPVALVAVCKQVIETLAQRLRDCGGTIVCTIPAEMEVAGYRAYVSSIFFNLLANAINYRSDARPLHVTIAATQPTGQETIVTVTDNGMGIDLKKAGTDMFQLYKRFHTGPAGRGMGLFLVKAHLEAMGGRVEVSSLPEEGTCFTLYFA